MTGLYELRDRRGRAIEGYEKFIDILKNADAGIAEVEDSRERLRELRQ